MKRESNIIKFIKNKWYVHSFLIEFEWLSSFEISENLEIDTTRKTYIATKLLQKKKEL